MDTNEPPTPPPTPPPRPDSAPPPPTPPPVRPWDTPRAPVLPPGASSIGMPVPLDLMVTKRLLWVAGAAYPLQNVARVYTFVLHPRRAEAVIRFFKRSTVAVLVAMAFTVFGGIAGFLARGDEGFEGIITFVWIATVVALVYFLADMIAIATASSHFVMAVESNGRSTALVTGEPARLNQLVQQVAHAIENPDTELSVRVERLTISNPSNYYFGDAVNMYGGQGNVGMSGV